MRAAVRVLLAGQFGPVALHYIYRDGGEEEVESVPSYIYLIRSGTHNILVDTSFSTPEDVLEKRGVKSTRLESEKPLNLLKQAGVTAKEVDILVYTHLHWDHAGNTGLFPRARVICQKKEMDWLANCPSWESGYDHSTREEIALLGDRLQIVEGDHQICPDVMLLRLGGHSPGSQAVVVRTEAGKVVIPGDLVNTYENLDREVPCGLVHNLDEAWQGLNRLIRESDIFLPSHDWKTFTIYGEQWV
jgi:N-acyl homoserine lactone hydrolase